MGSASLNALSEKLRLWSRNDPQDGVPDMSQLSEREGNLIVQLAECQANGAVLREMLAGWMEDIKASSVMTADESALNAVRAECYLLGMDACSEAVKKARLEVAEHILEMWREPWPVTQMRFIDRLERLVDGLK
jgi:hypothetical protein